MTKEEILEKNNAGGYVMDKRYRQLFGHRQYLYDAMEEYAKQECIDLLKHLSLKEYDFSSYAPSLDDKDAMEFYEEYFNDKNK